MKNRAECSPFFLFAFLEAVAVAVVAVVAFCTLPAESPVKSSEKQGGMLAIFFFAAPRRPRVLCSFGAVWGHGGAIWAPFWVHLAPFASKAVPKVGQKRGSNAERRNYGKRVPPNCEIRSFWPPFWGRFGVNSARRRSRAGKKTFFESFLGR